MTTITTTPPIPPLCTTTGEHRTCAASTYRERVAEAMALRRAGLLHPPTVGPRSWADVQRSRDAALRCSTSLCGYDGRPR